MYRLPLLLLALGLLAPLRAQAFCGFYVGKAGADLYNHASQVVLVRDGNRTVLTMSNDFQGDAKDFALVVPVPAVLEKEQIHVGERKYIERIDSYSAPRLVEYFDPNPCEPMVLGGIGGLGTRGMGVGGGGKGRASEERSRSLGVKVEAEYTVGEYDIVLLSAKQSEGLETWLRESGYQIPPRAAAALQPYIKQDMKFFVAKVNLAEREKAGFKFLRPIQIAYENPKFMLPIRLGMANSRGEQDLLVYAITKKGRVESANYQTVKMPAEMDVPLYVKDDFKHFYASVFETAHRKTNYRAVHTEYFWDSTWCDPCADNPLTPEELRGLGVYWSAGGGRGGFGGLGAGGGTLITRLHVRYDSEHFPEDLVFHETGDRQNFQARYVLRHPAQGDLSCDAGKQYLRDLKDRHAQEAKTLAELTGWRPADIAKKMGPDAAPADDGRWYKDLWK